MSKWFTFRQNNSGGAFEHEPQNGIGIAVFVEAHDADHARVRAEQIGLYFNGCDAGIDCDCCGDRWSMPWNDDGDSAPALYGDKFRAMREGEAPWQDWGINGYVHPLEGDFSLAVKDEIATPVNQATGD